MEISVSSFSGGITDEVVGAPSNRYLRGDNLLVNRDEQLYSRPGSDFLDANYAQLPTGVQEVSALFNFKTDTTLFALSSTSLYRKSTTAWTAILGPTSHLAFPDAISGSRFTSAEWKGHLFLADSTQGWPLKVYIDETGAYQARTVGMPPVADSANYVTATVLAAAITLANELRTDMALHWANLTKHRAADTVAAALLSAAAATDLPTLLILVNQLISAHGSHYRDGATAGVYHTPYLDYSTTQAMAPLSDMKLASTITATTLLHCVSLLNDLKTKYNSHDGSAVLHKDQSGTFPITSPFLSATSGPSFAGPEATMYALANVIKAQWNLHLIDAAAATDAHGLADGTNTITEAAATTPETLELLLWNFFYSYFIFGGTSHYADAALPAAWTWHIAAGTATHPQTHVVNAGTLLSATRVAADAFGGARGGNNTVLVARLNEIRTVMNAHMGDLGSHFTNNPASYIPETIPGSTLTLGNYLYAFVWKYSYYVATENFIDRGPPLLKSATSVMSVENTPMVISNLPVFTNAANQNHDTTNMVLEIYRTTTNGTEYFLVGSVANGVTTFTDSVTDIELQTKEQLYTAGGVVDRDQPPRCKFVHQVNNFNYYGNIIDASGVYLPHRIRQSLANSPSASPGDFFVDLPRDVMGVSSARDIPVAFTASGVYRLAGSMSEVGTGAIDGPSISENIGCVASGSIVKIEEGLVFAGTDGFYYTDGYRLQKLSKHWNTTYQGLISSATKRGNIAGTYDKLNRRVWWAVTRDNALVNDACFILDLEFGLKEDACFTTASGGDSFNPTAITFFNGQLVRGHQYGYVFAHDDLTTADPEVDRALGVAFWNTQAVIYDYLSVAFDGGTTQLRKRASLLITQFNGVGNASIQPIAVNDLGKSTKSLTPIAYRGNMVWGDPQVVWGDSTVEWDTEGEIEEKRHFTGGALNFTHKQIGFTNARVDYCNSDVYGKATLTRATPIFVLLGVAIWPLGLASEMTVAFENDGYVLEFAIVSQTVGQLTLSDPSNLLPANGNYKWVVRGIPKNEKIQILSYTVPCVVLGVTPAAAGGEGGANA